MTRLAELERASCWNGHLTAALESICVTHLLKEASTCLQLRFDLRGVEREKLSIKYKMSS